MNSDRGNDNVTLPQKRLELVSILNELSNFDKQLELWINHSDYPSISGIDEVFHFFFDDNDLGNNPKSEIGRILKNPNEAAVIERVSNALDRLHDKLGDVESSNFMSDKDWPALMQLAKFALQVMA